MRSCRRPGKPRSICSRLRSKTLYGDSATPRFVLASFKIPSRIGDVIDLTLLVERIGRSSLRIAIVGHHAGLERLRARMVTAMMSLPIGLEFGLCPGSYLKRCLSARRAIHLYAATFLMSAAAAASSPSASLITERRRAPTAAFASNMLSARRAASAMLLA
jgi:hypothetical protein